MTRFPVHVAVLAAWLAAMIAIAIRGLLPAPAADGDTSSSIRHDADVELALRFLEACEPKPDHRVIVECYRGLAVCNRWERDNENRGRMNRVERVVFGSALEYCGRNEKTK